MGIKNFFNSIIYNNEEIGNKAILKNVKKNKISCNFLYIDFNCIMYLVAEKIEVELNNLLYKLITKKIDENDSHFIFIKNKYNLKGNLDDIINNIKYLDIDNIFIKMIKEYILNLLNYFENNQLKILFFSIDGMPDMSKIYQQRKKKYSLFILNKINKQILKYFEDKIPEIRLLFEKKSFVFNRSIINPHSIFFNKLLNELNSTQFKSSIKSFAINIENIIISHNKIPGEGEKKIMEHINKFDRYGSYCIFSTDSDVILLTLLNKNLIINKSSSFSILKYDFITENLNLLNIDIISNNIITYIKKIIEIEIGIDESNIIKDVCFLFSIFGNDYIPKIFTINIDLHLKLVLHNYIFILLKQNKLNLFDIKYYLINFDNNKYNINWLFLMEYFSSLKEYEHNLYSDIYIEKFYNKFWIKKYSNDYTLTETLYKYVNIINNIMFPMLYEYKNNLNCEKNLEKCKINLLDKLNYNDDVLLFLKFFIASHKFDIDFCNILDNDDIDFQIQYYIEYIFNNLNLKIKFNNLVKKSVNIISKDINNNEIKKKIKEYSKIDDFQYSDYDIEIFKVEKRLHPWNICFNDLDNNLGHISFNYVIKKNIPKYDIIRKNNVVTNYQIYLNDYLNLKSGDMYKINKFCENYIISLHWLMDFYFNKNDKLINNEYACLFSYNNHYSPSIYMISNYFTEIYNNYTKNEENYDDKNYIFKKLMKCDLEKIFSYENSLIYIKRDKFFNKDQHYMFIHPVSDKDFSTIDNIYRDFRKDRNIFPDLKSNALKIYENKDKYLNIIDCKGTTYNNSCELKNNIIPFYDFVEFKNIISKYEENTNIVNDINYDFNEIYIY